MSYHYPKVDVYVDPVEMKEGVFDRVLGVQVDGVPWPVTEANWSLLNDRNGALITLSVRGRLRIHEGMPEETT